METLIGAAVLAAGIVVAAVLLTRHRAVAHAVLPAQAQTQPHARVAAAAPAQAPATMPPARTTAAITSSIAVSSLRRPRCRGRPSVPRVRGATDRPREWRVDGNGSAALRAALQWRCGGTKIWLDGRRGPAEAFTM